MIGVNQILGTFFNKQERAWQNVLVQKWATIMGALHTRVRLEKIEGTMVVMGVYDSHWMHELFMLTPTLIATINSHLDKAYVTHVKLQLIRKKKAPLVFGVQPKKSVKKRPPVTTPRHERALEAVNDEQLQTLLRRLLQQCTPSGNS